MWAWLISPIDPARAHEIGLALAWHGRLMVLGWGILAPLAILIARFFKIMPGQDWPRQVDSTVWWRTHWIGQSLVLGVTLGGISLAVSSDLEGRGLHGWLGYGVLVGALVQVMLGVFRGSKGGPTGKSLRGHHYDMTPWRRMFEAVHKTMGYGVLALAAFTILLGLWHANAPVWMWLALALWWPLLIATFIILQKRGMAVDTYQAIWGPDLHHPGNQRQAPGWGVRRPGDNEGDNDVRSDRGHRVRSH